MIKFKSQRVETCCEKHEKNKKTKEQEPDIEPRFFFFSHFILYHENSFSFFSHSPCSNRRRPTAVKKEDQQTTKFLHESFKEGNLANLHENILQAHFSIASAQFIKKYHVVVHVNLH